MARRKGFKIPGVSFSWKRATGLTSLRQKVARATGIPTTKQGRRRKFALFGLPFLLKGATRAGRSSGPSTPTGDERPDLWCGSCGYTWKPRGRDYSVKCPSCGAALGEEQFEIEEAREQTERAREMEFQRRSREQAKVGAWGCVGILAATCVCCIGAPFALMLGAGPAEKPTPVAKSEPAPAKVEAPQPAKQTVHKLEASAPASETRVSERSLADLVDTKRVVLPKPTETPPPKHETRTWTSSQGGFHVEATFVSAGAGKVKLRKADGEIITVTLEKLSDNDRAYVHSLR